MMCNTKSLRIVSLTLACTVAAGIALAADRRVQLDNGTSLAATDVALAKGGWMTFKMSNGTRAVAMVDPSAEIDAPAIDGWRDAVLLLHAGGSVPFRGAVTANGSALVFKRRDGLALTLPASQVARVTAVRVVENGRRPVPAPVASPRVTAVAITNEDLPEVDDPSPEVQPEEDQDAENGEEPEIRSDSQAMPDKEDEDWWRSEMERLNSKLETARQAIYVATKERRALEAEIEASGGMESSEQKQLRLKIDRRIRMAEKERNAIVSERDKLREEARQAKIPESWLRGS